jgi:hypothetical protein
MIALQWGVRRLLSKRSPILRDTATRSWEICPAQTIPTRPAIYLDGCLDRVSGLSPWRTWEMEERYLKGGPFEHGATRAHLIENVKISGAYLYRGRARMQQGFGQASLKQQSTEPYKQFNEASLTSNWAGSQFFGTFMRGALPQELLPREDERPISLVTKYYKHESDYRTILGQPQPQLVRSGHVKRLILYTDQGQNHSKTERYEQMRQRLRQNLGAAHSPAPGVYLKRGATGEKRLVSNEAEVEATLAAYGFDIIEPSKLTSREISQRILNTPIVVSVEGSHMAHAIYSMAPDGAFVVLQPPNRFAMAFKEFADAAGLRFAFTIGHLAGDNCFSVDIDEMKRTLDLL